MTSLLRLIPFLLLMLLLPAGMRTTPALAQAGNAAGVTLSAEAGYGSRAPAEGWIPVHVRVTNDGPPIEGQIVVTTGRDSSRYTHPVSLPTRSAKELTLYVSALARSSSLFRVVLEDQNGNTIAELPSLRKPLTVPNRDLFWAVVSNEPVPLDWLGSVRGGYPNAGVTLFSPDQLPEAGAALDGIDIIVLTHLDSSRLSSARLSALRHWVEVGGTLVVMGGNQAQQTATALADWLPVTPAASQSVSGPLGLGWQGAPLLYTVNSLRPGSEVLLGDVGHNILTRIEAGRGQVLYLALDAQLEPLTDLTTARPIWNRVAEAHGKRVAWDRGILSGEYYSYSVQNAARTFPALQLPSAGWLLGFLLVYIVLIGPLNYFFLKRRGRQDLAWFTIPALILLFTGGAWLVGNRMRGGDLLVNQVTVAIGDVRSAVARHESVTAVYSPGRDTLNLAFAPGTMPVRLDAEQFGPLSVGRTDLQWEGVAATLEGVRFAVADITLMHGVDYRPKPDLTATARLVQSGGSPTLSAEITNHSDRTFETLSLFIGTAAFSLGDLPPGETVARSFPLTPAQSNTLAQLLDSRERTVALDMTTADEWGLRGQLAMADFATTGYYDYNDSRLRIRNDLMQSAWSTEWNETAGAAPPVPAPVAGRPPDYFLTMPAGKLLLTFWIEGRETGLQVANRPMQPTTTTLYLLELPVER
jgi:hypothetical protein